MTGSFDIVIKHNNVEYKFNINRKFTILLGESGSGKTSLVRMVLEKGAVKNKDAYKLAVLENGSPDIVSAILSGTSNHIYLIDEGFSGLEDINFQKELCKSDNYFIIITRDSLRYIPYSIDSIFELKSSSHKYGNTGRLYTRVEFNQKYVDRLDGVRPDVILCEDSSAGLQFFRSVLHGIRCESSFGNSRMLSEVKKYSGTICCIVDGAAFGSYISGFVNYIDHCDNKVILIAPESFEWLLLKAETVPYDKDVLERPYLYCDASSFAELTGDFDVGEESFVSWERLFFRYLQYCSKQRGKFAEYTKTELKEYYLGYADKVLSLLPDLIINI